MAFPQRKVILSLAFQLWLCFFIYIKIILQQNRSITTFATMRNILTLLIFEVTILK